MTAADLVHDRTHIDWITVTHDDPEPLRAFLQGPTECLAKGWNVYPHAERDAFGGMLCSRGPEPRPFLLMMPGKALNAWRMHSDDQGLIYQLAFDGVHCTRLDIARDTSGPWTPYRLREHAESDRYISRWKEPTYRCKKGNRELTVGEGTPAT